MERSRRWRVEIFKQGLVWVYKLKGTQTELCRVILWHTGRSEICI